MNSAAPSPGPIDTVVFDLGNVLIQWDPRHLYRKIFGADEAAMEYFLSEVCSMAWNEQQDRGRPWAEGIAEASARHPAYASQIRAFYDRWDEMIPGALDDTVEILQQLRALNLRLLALTNWSAQTYHFAEDRFPFLSWFEGIVVSGRERLVKPEPAIFQLLIQRYHLRPETTAFIDDSLRNVVAAQGEGLQAIHFHGAGALRLQLQALGIPVR